MFELTNLEVRQLADEANINRNGLEFVDDFNNKISSPNKLFDGMSTNNLTNHPMGIWKTK